MDKKILIIIAAVAVCVIAAAAALILLNGDNSPSEKVEQTDRLMILGNANNDDYIDNKDITTLNSIIKAGTWDKKTHPYADANNDGKITESDVDFVRQMIQKKEMKIFYVDRDGNIDNLMYPLTKIVTVGTYTANIAVELGICDKVGGISGSKTWSNSDMWADLKDKPQISSNSITADIGLVSKVGGVDGVLTTGIDNADDFEKANIDVVKLDYSGENELGATLMLGYFIQAEERSHKIAEFFDEVYAKLDKVVAKHASEPVMTAVVVYMEKYVYSDAGSHGSIADKAGIDNAWKYNSGTDTANYLKVAAGSEWIRNENWKNASVIIGQEKWLYADGIDVEATWKAYEDYYSSIKAFPKKTCLVNESMTLPVQVAYLMEWLFPDDVESGYGDKMHQKYIDTFVDALSGNYDVTKRGAFFFTGENRS